MKRHRVFLTLSHVVLIFLCITALAPFWLLLVSSLSAENSAVKNGYSFWPKEWSLEAYEFLWNKISWFGRGYVITIIVTVIGVLLSIIITLMLGYMLSRRQMPFVKVFDFYIIFTMLFNGGLVATYITYTQYFHIKDTLWAYIVPGLLTNAFYIMLVKNYFINNIPDELMESARIDGANEYKIFFKIAMPLAKPIIATVALMVGVMYWNDWQNGMYYIDDQKLFGIQNILNAINSNAKYLSQYGGITGFVPKETARMAAALIAIIPILVVYPFFQGYFVKGITMGSVKG